MDTTISYYTYLLNNCVAVIRVLINIPQLLTSMNLIGFQQEKNSFVKLVKQMHYCLFGNSLSDVGHQYKKNNCNHAFNNVCGSFLKDSDDLGFNCKIMDAKVISKTTSKDQSIEQALRRLKYLHTSLMPHEGSTRQNGHKLNDGILWTKELKPRHEEQLTRARRPPEKQYFLSLQPKTPSMSREKIKARIVKRKQQKKGVRTGRAPLQAYRETNSSVTAQEILQSKRDNMINSREINPVCEERISRSTSGMFRTNDPHKCIQCLRKDFGENANKPNRQKPTKEYLTNMRINRVTFSARPSGYKVKSVRESKSKTDTIEVPKSCFLNGWGVRLTKESLPQGGDSNINNDLNRNAVKETMEVTAGLKTLKLVPKRMQKGQAEQTIPQPPPTPVRQIDIKLPQGLMVRYQLSEDD